MMDRNTGKRGSTLPLIWWGPLLLIPVALLLEYSGIDLWLAARFFDASAGTWPWNDHWFTNDLLHTGGRHFTLLLALLIVLLIALTFLVKRVRPYRKGFLYLLLGSALGPILVSISKKTTHIYCPWDLKQFGGTEPYIRLLDAVPEGASIGHAFPAGHASGGFAFLSLYFFLYRYFPSRRHGGFSFGFLLGTLYGIAQQMRGAHFLSHDLFSLVICWFSAMAVYLLMFRSPDRFSEKAGAG